MGKSGEEEEISEIGVNEMEEEKDVSLEYIGQRCLFVFQMM